MRLSPLRLWLQSTSLLAVLAGYSLLLLVNQRIAAFDRVAAHRQTAEQLAAELERRASGSAQLQSLLASSLLPNMRLSLLPAAAPAVHDDGCPWCFQLAAGRGPDWARVHWRSLDPGRLAGDAQLRSSDWL